MEMSVSDGSTLLTAPPASTSLLLRRHSSGHGTSKTARGGISRRTSLDVKYAGMTLQKALSLACPSLQTLDGVSLAKQRAENARGEAGGGDMKAGGDDGFHTWCAAVVEMLASLSSLVFLSCY